MYKIIEIDNVSQEIWNACVQKNNGHFLQSYEWGQFNISQGHRVWYLGVYNSKNELVATVLAVHRLSIHFLHWIYIPFMAPYTPDIQRAIVTYVKGLSQEIHAIGVRIEPQALGNDSGFEHYGFQKSTLHIQPPETVILDLSDSQDILLQNMHKKTRYNIRLAQKKGLVIRADYSGKYISEFITLLRQTSKRNNFSHHKANYYIALVQQMNAYLIGAWHNDMLICMNMLIDYNGTTIYLHGASDHASRALMAPYLVQWESIVAAKRKGQSWYDFWGVSIHGGNDSWVGFTRFKMGFVLSAAHREYPGMYVYIASYIKYYLFICLKYLQRMRSRFLS